MRLIQMIDRYARLYAEGSKTGYRYQSFYDLVADHGQHFNLVPCPKNMRGIPQHCYHNCTIEAKKSRRKAKPYLYCEGYYTDNETGFPILHAWLMDADGNAIDPTIPARRNSLNPEYFGVALDLKFVLWHQKVSQQSAIYESDYMHRYQLLHEGFPDGAVLNTSELQTLKQQAQKQRLKFNSNLRPAEVLLHLTTTLHEVAKSC